ncbi:MAG TPA: TetR/AcrR family transcriptional regulator [Candidatus Nesterenkonia stercoripullorum]|uniref:TetR/AcrR family transcriptional regulator n=1 Tax=Candidatus Nesterenkonia stercoripullorum TaxID=2838701 RepID=A0A9D1URG8_9MICC|nr:TetR/AcrR family transcriptional regulator [Candidatus Nesterenkonia stercoripullorum]
MSGPHALGSTLRPDDRRACNGPLPATSTDTGTGTEAGTGTDTAAGTAWPVARRRGRPGYDRETLIRICVETFNRHGYEATSMGMLGQALGLCKSAIYHHVDSKEKILDTALERALTAVESVLEGAHCLGLSPARELEEVLAGCVHAVDASLPHMTLLMRLRGNSELERRAIHRRQALERRICELIARAQAEGEIREDVDADTTSWMVMGIITSLVEWYSPERVTSVEDLAEKVVRMALGGFRQAPAPPSPGPLMRN